MRYPRNPLDVLAQQIVAACAIDEWDVDDLLRARCGAARTSPSSPTTCSARRSTCSRAATPPTGSPGCGRASCGTACRAACAAAKARSASRSQSGGTIPDRGLFGVFLPDGVRVGELDEEMVYESRVGECFVLGASTWRIEEITVDRVVVTPAPGEPAKTPFWKGDRPGRPLELGRALGKLVARAARAPGRRRPKRGSRASGPRRARGVEPAAVPRRAGRGHRRGPRRPHDRDRALPRRDRRLARLHPHAVRLAGARAVGARDRGAARARRPAGAGAVERRRHHLAPPRSRSTTSRLELLLPDPDELDDLVVDAAAEHVAVRVAVPRERGARAAAPAPAAGRAHAAVAAAPARGRPARGRVRLPDVPDAARDDARVPPRRLRRPRAARGARRHPLAQAARRAGRDAARVAVRAVAAVRLDRGLHVRGRRAARRTARRRARARPRPAARPHGRRGAARAPRSRGARRSSSSSCSASCPNAARPPRRRPARPARRPRPARRSTSSRARCDDRSGSRGSTTLLAERRVIRGRRSATRPPRTRPGCATRSGWRSRRACPTAFTDPVDRPLDDLVARYARTHVPFTIDDVARAPRRLRRARPRRARRASKPTAASCIGEFRPGGVEREWCDADVLRVLRRRSLAALRHEIEPVDASTFARFLPAWQGVGRGRRGTDALVEALEQLQGVAIPASVLERDVLPARVDGYRPAMLDELCAAGELVWIGAGALGADDGRVRLFFRDRVRLLAPRPADRRRARRRGARRDPRPACCARARASGPTSSPPRAPPTKPWCSPRCGISCGRARSPTTRSVRCASPRRVDRAPRRPRGRPQPGRLARLGPPAGAGRWSLVVPLLEPAPAPTEAAHAHRAATARTPRRRHPRGRARRRHARRVRRRVSRAARARRVGPGAARLVRRRARRRAVRAAGRGRPAARAPHDRRRRAAPACSCSPPPIPRSRTAPRSLARAPRAGRRAPRGAYVVLVDGECAAYVERGGKTLAHVRRPRPPTRGPSALVEAHKEGRLGRLQIERIDDEPARTSPHARGACAPPASPTATRA